MEEQKQNKLLEASVCSKQLGWTTETNEEWECACSPTQHSHDRGESRKLETCALFSTSYWLALGSYFPFPTALCMPCQALR